MPVILPTATITTLTPPAAIINYALETTGNLAIIAGKDFATQTTLALIKAKTDNLDVALSTRGVTGLTDAQLRATAVPISLATAPTTPVTGTFFQATQPVSAASLPLPTGAATEATLARINTQGQKAMSASTPVVIASDQSTVNVAMAAASVLFRGKVLTFNTPGRAGTVGQKILSLHNATNSTIKVYITKVVVDAAFTVVKAVTIAPPMIRLWKVTVLPTNGTSIAKTKIGGTTTSNASVTVLGDASADGTGSATTLTATLPAGAIITQEYAPRFITAAGYEPADRVEFEISGEIELNALEGVVLFLDYVLATQNPTTDRWIAGMEWYEK